MSRGSLGAIQLKNVANLGALSLRILNLQGCPSQQLCFIGRSPFRVLRTSLQCSRGRHTATDINGRSRGISGKSIFRFSCDPGTIFDRSEALLLPVTNPCVSLRIDSRQSRKRCVFGLGHEFGLAQAFQLQFMSADV
jgi:hypothetical protein